MADQPAAAPATPAAATPAAATPAVSPCGGFGFGGGGTTGSTGTTGTAAEGGSAPSAQQGLGGMLFPIAIFILIFYFMILRPQNKRKKQQDALINGITRGDQVVTISGVFGTVREVRDDSFLVEIADGVKIRVLKSAVQTKKTAAQEEKKD